MRNVSAVSTDPTQWGAAEIARRIANRETSAVEVTQAFIARIEAVNPQLNAVVVRTFDEALRTAEAADQKLASGAPVGLLHGVPMTVKECFHIAGTPSTIGLARYQNELIAEEGLLVQRLRQAGVIVLGKTNVPQMMIWHECDNPVYGRTNNPWDVQRTPGGSTGGEAAIIAARGSPLGLGNDLGGSIRIPAHFCGIAGLKPTNYRLPRGGARGTLFGMEAIWSQSGPLARRVEDLSLALRVLAGNDSNNDASNNGYGEVLSPPLGDPANVRIEGLRVAFWTDDGFFPASVAIQRAVQEAAQALRQRGAIVEPFEPPGVVEAIEIYIALIGADGGAGARRLTRGSALDWRVARLIWLAGMSLPVRLTLARSLEAFGQRWMARLVRLARSRTADDYWQLIDRKNVLVAQFMDKLKAQRFDAFICPPHALPAMQHGKPIDLLAASSYALLPNLLGNPVGVVPITRVRADEEGRRKQSRDQVDQQAIAVDRGSAGLPIGVQIGALPWREDIVLAVMSALEVHFQNQPDYPCRAELPIGHRA